MPKRAQKWVIHENARGAWDLSRGGRYFYTGLSSRAECLARLKNHYKPGETVFFEEQDGYRTNITSQLKKNRVL